MAPGSQVGNSVQPLQCQRIRRFGHHPSSQPGPRSHNRDLEKAWVLQHLQCAQQELSRDSDLLGKTELQPQDHADGHCYNDKIETSLHDAACEPEDVIVEAISRIGGAVEPRPLEGNAIQQICQGAAEPEEDHEHGDDDHLTTERGAG